MGQKNVQVAIVGAGPVGLSLAALLRQQEILAIVFERRAELHRQPQAHVINTRTMEVFRTFGADRKVAAMGAPMAKMRFINWCQSLAGREFGKLSLLGSSPESAMARLSGSPVAVTNLAQNRLEPILYKRALELGAEVKFNHTVTGIKSHADNAVLHVQGPDGSEAEWQADYVVACDGARSRLREAAGIEMIGPASLQKLITVYFTANLDRVLGGRLGPVHWVIGPDVRGVLIGFDLAKTWALMVPYDEPDMPEDYTMEVAAAMVRKAIGDPAIKFEINSIGNWNMSAQVAETYRRERLFLAGDAAHRFPPSGGLGMNTGVQDAHNLAWKLAAVLKGEAGEALLDSYQQERQLIAQTNCEQSVGNSMKMGAVDIALGASSMTPVCPADALSRDTAPPELGFDGDSEAAIAKRAAVQHAIDEQAEHFDSFGIDLGVNYETGAFCADGSQPVRSTVQTYVPNTRPGARLPHVWLLKNKRRVSTQDMVPSAGFVLFVSCRDRAWKDAVDHAATTTGQPIRVIRIGPDGDYQDPKGLWASYGGPVGDGALLVRPDGHVALRMTHHGFDATACLASAINSILCKKNSSGEVLRSPPATAV